LYFPNGTLIEKGIFKYNDKGWLIKKNVYFKDGSLEGTTSYEYNENGNIISEYRNGVVGTNVKCKYDNKGNMIEEVSLWGGKQTYKYNDEGKVIEKKEHSRDEYYMWIYTYDNIGYIKSSKEYGYDGKLNGYETYEYDSNENIKKNFEYYRDGELLSIITFEYDFDKKGNWIRRISYRENPPKIKNPRYIVKREIVYYDN
jgi:hypothetical protein